MAELLGTVGRYELVREIGRGGMATVFLARQIDLDRFVALKQLIRAHTDDEDSWGRRFLRESRLAGSLAHPNIVTVFDFVESDGTPYIAMELMPRGSLRQHVASGLTVPQKAGALADTLAGLAYAERQGIVHRDLKPENLMVTGEGGIKIADFGIAKASKPVHTRDFRTATGTTMGTPGYMAPEQAMGQDVGPWTDLYSLGCIAYELFTGAIPFADTEAPMAMLLRHINEPIPSAHAVRPNVSPEVSAWIERLLVKDPAQRTSAARNALDELDELMIDLVGPRWRRDAALAEQIETGAIGGPWTPPPGDAISYQTYAPTPDAAVSPVEPVAEEPVARETYVEPHPVEAENTATPMAPTVGEPAVPEPAVTAPPIRPPDPPSPPRSGPGRRRRAVLGVGAIAATGIVLTVALLVSGGDKPKATGSSTAAARIGGSGDTLSAGPLEARTPSRWKRTSTAPDLPGLELSPRAAATAANGIVTIGIAPRGTANPTLLPSAFEKLLDSVPKPETTALGGDLTAYHYAGLRARGVDGSLDLFVLPTSAGVAVVACSQASIAAVSRACRTAAESLEITGARTFKPGPDAAYARTLASAVAALEKSAASAHAGLGRARAHERRYRERAADLGRAFTAAADLLEKADVNPADASANTAFVKALGAAATSYRNLSSKARREHPARSRSAAARAAKGERIAGTSLDRLLGTGYDDLVGPRLRVRPVPALKRKPRPLRPGTQNPVTPTATPAGTAAPTRTTTPIQPSRPRQPVTTSTPQPTATARPPVTTEG